MLIYGFRQLDLCVFKNNIDIEDYAHNNRTESVENHLTALDTKVQTILGLYLGQIFVDENRQKLVPATVALPDTSLLHDKPLMELMA